MGTRLITTLLFLCSIVAMGQTPKYKFLVGTYTQKGSDGIYYCEFDPSKKAVKIISHSENLNDPSFLVVSKDQKFIY
jgi:6-phosphogluconolactonase (cycloisomerase 2 family)